MALKFYQNKNWLHKEYVTKGRSATDIAKEQGVSVKTIDRYLETFGLKRNSRSWRRG